jgi:hypothetical protein
MVRSFFTIYLFQGHAFGAPGRPAPAGLRTWARDRRGEHLDGRGFPSRAAEVAGSLAAGGRRPRPAALALGTHGAGRRRRAVPPHPPPGGPRGHASRLIAPARAAGPSSPRRASCRRGSSQSRARPYGRVPPLRSGQAPDSELPRQDPAPAGEDGREPGPRQFLVTIAGWLAPIAGASPRSGRSHRSA